MHDTLQQSHFAVMTQLLHDEQQLLIDLERCLQQERQLVEQNEAPESIVQSNQSKTQLYLALQQCHSKQSTLLSEVNLSHDSQGMLAFFSLQNANTHDESMNLWRDIENRLAHCREMNLINGALISSGYEHMQRILQIIFHANDPVKTYDQKGVKSAVSDSQFHTKA